MVHGLFPTCKQRPHVKRLTESEGSDGADLTITTLKAKASEASMHKEPNLTDIFFFTRPIHSTVDFTEPRKQSE